VRVDQVPPRDPISEGWMNRGAAVDYVGRMERSCPRCGGATAQDEYMVILGRHFGLGAPYFVKPFLKRSSTKGKLGKRSNWFVCAQCGSMLPADAAAQEEAQGFGQPQGFIH
jgi:hypothetical protein